MLLKMRTLSASDMAMFTICTIPEAINYRAAHNEEVPYMYACVEYMEN